MKPIARTRIVDGLRYNVDTATLIASDAYWDGHNYERHGTNTFLFRTPRGRFFIQTRSQLQGADDGALTPVTADEAINLYTHALREHEMPFEDAFPEIQIEEA